MIRTKINTVFPGHQIVPYERNLFLADYTEQTKKEAVKRGVEIHEEIPTDIIPFCLRNPSPVKTGTIIYDNWSFVGAAGQPLSQCECVVFPYVSDEKSWVLFLELKYCGCKKKQRNLNKAKDQLFATYNHFKTQGITTAKQLKYLIVSLPKQNDAPFEGFLFSPADLAGWKNREGLIFRGINEAEIQNPQMICV